MNYYKTQTVEVTSEGFKELVQKLQAGTFIKIAEDYTHDKNHVLVVILSNTYDDLKHNFVHFMRAL